MAITDITIVQDNIYGDSNLIPIHSPVVFVMDVTYTSVAPDELNVEIYDNDGVTLLAEARCIPYNDSTATIRQFVFRAEQIVRGLMDSFDDTFQANETFVHIPEITKELKLKFVDPDDELIFDENTFVFIHGSNQFAENPNKENIYDNEVDVYYAAKDSIVYAYFYNNDTANTVEVDAPFYEFGDAADFDDDIFTDYDNEVFEIIGV